jgi:hypothetical protein
LRDEKLIQNFGKKLEGMRMIVRHKHRLENNIKMELKGIGYEVVE